MTNYLLFHNRLLSHNQRHLAVAIYPQKLKRHAWPFTVGNEDDTCTLHHSHRQFLNAEVKADSFETAQAPSQKLSGSELVSCHHANLSVSRYSEDEVSTPVRGSEFSPLECHAHFQTGCRDFSLGNLVCSSLSQPHIYTSCT